MQDPVIKAQIAQTLEFFGETSSESESLDLSGIYMGEVEGARLPSVSIQIKPRIQKDKWSLYWKVLRA